MTNRRELVSLFFAQLHSGVQHPTWDGAEPIYIDGADDPRLHRGLLPDRRDLSSSYPVGFRVRYDPARTYFPKFSVDTTYWIEGVYGPYRNFDTYEEAVAFALEERVLFEIVD